MVNTQQRAFAHAGSQEPGTKSCSALSNALFPQAHSVCDVSWHQSALQDVDAEQVVIETMVERAVHAQRAFLDWSEERIDQLLQALAESVSRHAEDLAIAAVQETRLGNVADKTAKNRFASLEVYRSLVGQVGQGRLWQDKRRKVRALASPVGVVFDLIPATNPTSTFIFKVLICLKGRNAIILSPSQRAQGVSNQLGELIQAVLGEQGAPVDLVQWVRSNNNRTTTLAINVSYSHLLNIKRVAYYTAPKPLSEPGSSRAWLRPDLLMKAGMAVVWRQFFRRGSQYLQ